MAKQVTFKIKPAQTSVNVRDPESRKLLKKDGEIKPRNEYWLRRIADGSVVEMKPKQENK